MKDIVRLKLIEIVTQYGQIVIENPRKVEGLLRDFCGDHKREIHGLMDAMRERVPLDLRAAGRGTPAAILLANLTRRLLDSRPMAEDMAHWAVESWAIALGVIPLDGGSETNTVRPHPVQTVQPALTPTLNRGGIDPEMVQIPAGEFWMGSRDEDKNALDWDKPYHKVYLDEYWIGKKPVTVAEFGQFVERRGYCTLAEKRDCEFAWQKLRSKGNILDGKEDYPVTLISWGDAMAYCQWLSQVSGRRYGLPSEAQWEKAARGVDGRIYPWGNEAPDKSRCNDPFGDMTPVGKFSPAGDSTYGCVDMLGNARQWCADWWSETYYRVSPVRNPVGPASGDRHSIRGSSSYSYFYNCASRDRLTRAALFDYDLGFRVVSPDAF